MFISSQCENRYFDYRTGNGVDTKIRCNNLLGLMILKIKNCYRIGI